MNATRTMLVILALATSATATSQAADHDHRYQVIANHAEEIVDASRDLHDELRFHFRDSRVYGELLAVNGQIRGTASSLKSQARRGRSVASCHQSLDKLHELVGELEQLMDELQFRVARRIERPIIHFREAQRHVRVMHEAVDCLIREESFFGYRGARTSPWSHGHTDGRWEMDRRAYGDGRGRSFESYGANPIVGWNGGAGPGMTLRAGDWSVQLQR